MSSPLATKKQAAEFLNISRKTFDRHVRDELPTVTIGGENDVRVVGSAPMGGKPKGRTFEADTSAAAVIKVHVSRSGGRAS